MTNRSKLAGLTLALLSVVACGGAGNGTTVPTSSPDSPTISISGFSFGDPATVSVGQEVRVVNEDSTSHTWTSADGLFDSGSLAGGETFAHTFEEAGEYRFFCGIHPDMTGSITVEG